MSKNSQNNRVSQNRANPAPNRDVRASANPPKSTQTGSVSGRNGLGPDKNAANRTNPAKSSQTGSASGKSKFRLGKKPKKAKKLANAPRVVPNGAANGHTANAQNRSAQPPHSPAKPVNEQARKAADRAAQAKMRAGAPEKKRPYRGGNYTLYFVLAAIVVGIVMAILSNTVLFKCGTIEVTGTTRYTSEEIIVAAGVKTGENLLHIDAKKAENGVMSAFAFVDKVSVKKSYPTKIIIEITEAQNWFALNQDGKTVVISRGGRVLGAISADGLVVVKGFEAESLETGSQLCSKVDAKNKIIMEIFETAEKVGLANVTEIDLTDRFSIKITVDDRIVLNLGSSVQLESKLRVGQALIEKEIAEDERVSVLLSNPEKVAVESLSRGQNPVQSSTEKPVQTESSDSQQNSTETPSEQPSENSSDEQTSAGG
ncbi:MAG: cell division protein FtsQ/DivIB [Oscillospiraceae bacterium]